MTATNRIDGAVKVVTGLGLMTAGVCFTLLGFWWMLPAVVYGGMRLGSGIGQAVTGLSDE